MSWGNRKTSVHGLMKFPLSSFPSMKDEGLSEDRGNRFSDNFRMPKQILIVEDDPSISKLLCELLLGWGFNILQASNGREGLQVVQENSVDGILLDLEMPVMDGWTMLDELRWQGYQIPVIVMSGGVDTQVLRNMLQEGAQGFLVKPFTLESLKLQCQRCIGSSQECVSGNSRMPTESQTVSPSFGRRSLSEL